MSTSTSNSSPIPHIHLLCMDPKFSTAFTSALASTPSLTLPHTIHECALTFLPPSTTFTCIVSPANSYGRLDGGFDDAISRFFSPQGKYLALTRVAQQTLYEQWKGFAPPGTCTLVKIPRAFGEGEMASKGATKAWGTRYLALCPTMRVPSDARWDREVVYECVWSLLCVVERHNRAVRQRKEASQGKGGEGDEELEIDSLLMTPLGTGIGKIGPEKWAQQTVLAIEHFQEACAKPEKWGALEPEQIIEHVEEVQKTW